VLADLNQSEANPVTPTCNGGTAAIDSSGCLSVAARRPIPTFTTIEETLPDGFLTYNGLQTKLEHRTGHGLYLLNSFTWSRAQDNAEGHLEEVNGDSGRINLANPLRDRGPSGYNQPLNEVLSIVYDLPYGKGRMFGGNAPRLMQEALGGWQITAINSASSGMPINLLPQQRPVGQHHPGPAPQRRARQPGHPQNTAHQVQWQSGYRRAAKPSPAGCAAHQPHLQPPDEQPALRQCGPQLGSL
jgi:hypothetical protein